MNCACYCRLRHAYNSVHLSLDWQYRNPHMGPLRALDARVYYNYIDHVMDKCCRHPGGIAAAPHRCTFPQHWYF